MKSRKLTVELKDKIVSNFVTHWKNQYNEPEEAESLEKIQSDFAKALRKENFGRYDDLPEGVANTSSTLRIRLPNDSVVEFPFLKDNFKNKWDRDQLVVPCVAGVDVDLIDQYENPHYLMYKEAMDTRKETDKKYQEWGKAKIDFACKIREVLDSVNTTKQFVEVWPEAEDFIPEEIRNPSAINLPALSNIEELNNIIK